MRKALLYILLALLAIIIIPVAFWGLRIVFDLSNPLRQPSEQIRERILELTPIGTSMDDVVRVAENNEWDFQVNNRVGVIMESMDRPGPPVGVQSIRVTLGMYKNFYETYTFVRWAFNENLELIDVFVFKQTVGF